MDVKLVVNCQYFENYNVGPEGFGEVPHWKPKGGHEFSVEVDSDVLLYGEEQIEKVLSKMVEEQSNEACKYEYRSYEIWWGEPTPLDSKEFQSKLEKEYE